MPIHLLLDWSGTLRDDLDETLAATNEVLRRFGGEPVDRATYRRDFRIPVWPFYADRLPAPHPEPAAVEEAFVEALAVAPRTGQVFAGARELLARAVAARGRTAIVSTLPHVVLEREVKASGLRCLVDAVHGSVADKRLFVPDLLQRMDLHPDETLFAGDTLHDLEAARAARVRAVALLHGYTEPSVLRAAAPDEIWTDLTEGLAWLDRLLATESGSWPVVVVGGAVLDADDRILLVRTAKWNGLWGTPGGKVEFGEALADAFVREVFEETGLRVSTPVHVLWDESIRSPEFFRPRHYVIHDFGARLIGDPCLHLSHEALEFIWTPLTQALERPLNSPTRRLIEHLLAHPELRP